MSYLLQSDNRAAGFGSVAVAGPWKDKPTVFEFYLLPEQRGRAFDFFEAFVAARTVRKQFSGAQNGKRICRGAPLKKVLGDIYPG